MKNPKIRRFFCRMSYAQKKNNVFLKFTLLSLFLLLIYTVFCYSKNIYPVLKELGESRASYLGDYIITNAVQNVLEKNDAIGNDVVKTIKTSDGKINAIIPNLNAINKLKNQISYEISRLMEKETNSTISIPLGNATGISYLSNIGPRIKFNLIPIGKSKIDFNTSFSQAGINQTRHEVKVTVTLNIGLIIGRNRSTSAQVTTTVPVSETIIVGDVPESYTHFITDDENARDDAVNMLE